MIGKLDALLFKVDHDDEPFSRLLSRSGLDDDSAPRAQLRAARVGRSRQSGNARADDQDIEAV